MKAKKEERPRVILVIRSIIMRGNRFLLIRRDITDEYAPGFWEVPGGKLDEGQDVRHAEEREVLEETGLVIVPSSPCAFVESYILSRGKYIGLPYVVLIGVSKYFAGDVKLSDEHDAWRWVTKEEALALPLKDDIRKAITVLL